MPGLDKVSVKRASASPENSTLVRDSGMVRNFSGGKRGLNQQPRKMRRSGKRGGRYCCGAFAAFASRHRGYSCAG